MKNKLRMFVALAVVCLMSLSMVACDYLNANKTNEGDATESPVVTATPEASLEPVSETPLVVAYNQFSEKFSPFFSDTGYDTDVYEMTQVLMMTTDRVGGIIFNAIEGETVSYNGVDYSYTGPCNISVDFDEATNITTYRVKIRDDIYFSDGVQATADDMIFTYYVFLDPAYVGSTTLNSYDIIGLKNYQTQTTDDIYAKYSAVYDAIYAAGAGYTATAGDIFTQEQYDSFWAILKEVWVGDVQAIVDYCAANYLSAYAEQATGKAPEVVAESDGLKVALGMWAWGYASGIGDDGKFYSASGKSWDLATTFPTVEDYYEEVYAAYSGDPEAYWNTEAADDSDVLGTAVTKFISACAATDPEMSGGIPNISGITKVDEYTVEVKVNGYSAPAIYSICGLPVAPLHYYGDAAQYDYANNKFGHPFNDLSIAQSKTTQPMGAGPYKFVKYENKTVYFEANDSYFKGAPKIKYIQFKETPPAEVAAAIKAGTVDCGELSGTKSNFEQLQSYNSNGELNGDVVFVSKVDNLGYGYIGINADNVCVGGDQGSEASKDLRKALATVLAVYRDTSYSSYYGEAASVINYPISNTSWAAPQPTDPDYKIAFSVDVNGKDIYTSDMTPDQRYATALETAKGFLVAAGFTFDEATGKFTAAPEGAKLSYEVIVPGDGTGTHPSFAVLTDAAAALQTIGIELKINDPVDSNVLWDSMDAGTQELWCAAWQTTIDPDMYQIYHSSGIVGRNGSDSNHYHIDNPELDTLILAARTSDDQAFRKATYKQCLDIIVDYAVEIPAYQRQNCIVFSVDRINLDSLTPDITTFWDWMKEIELVEMS